MLIKVGMESVHGTELHIYIYNVCVCDFQYIAGLASTVDEVKTSEASKKLKRSDFRTHAVSK